MEFVLIALSLAAIVFGLPILALVRASSLERRLAYLQREIDELRRSMAAPTVDESTQDDQQGILALGLPEPTVTAEPVAPETAGQDGDIDAPAPHEAQEPVRQAAMEQTVGTKWTVWIGGLALALGGIFLVRYTIEEGLLGPGVRVALGWLFAAALIAGAEYIRRRDLRLTLAGMPSAYIPGVLTAAGTLAAFASTYAAYALYGFLPPLLAFVLLAACSVAALFVSRLHGPSLAALGLLGSYVTPALVASQSPGAWALFSYLAFVTAAAYFVARLRGWLWLAVSATAGAVLWGLMWCAGNWSEGDTVPLGLYVLALTGLAFALLTEPDEDEESLEYERPLLAGLDWWAIAVLAAITLQIVPAVRLAAYDTASLIFLAATVAALLGGGWWWRSLAGLVPWSAILFGLVYLGWHIPKVFTAPLGPFDAYMGLAPIAPPGLWEFLSTGLIFAAAFGAAGFLMALEEGRHRFWALVSAAAPLAIFAYAYLRATDFTHSVPFGVLGLLSAFAYVAAVDAMQRRGNDERWGWRAGCYGAAAVVSLALAFTMVLEKGWLTIALALICPGLAWVASKRPVPGLRYLAAGMAAVVMLRLAYDPLIIGEDLGTTPIFNWLLYGYALPAVAFGVAAWLFAKQRDDVTVQILEAAAIMCAVALTGLQIRHAMNGGDVYSDTYGLAELSLHSITMIGLAIGLQRIYDGIAQRPTIDAAAAILGVAGLTVILVGHLLTKNPLFTGEPVGEGRFFNVLLLAYVVPALLCGLLYAMARGRRHELFVLAAGVTPLLLIFAYLTLEVRALFHGPVLTWGDATDGEWYAYSAVWLLYGVALLAAGILLGVAALRYASLAILILTVCKVFLFDLSGLSGILRALSFIGLGLVLVAIGYFYQRIVFPQSPPSSPPGPEPEPERSA